MNVKKGALQLYLYLYLRYVKSERINHANKQLLTYILIYTHKMIRRDKEDTASFGLQYGILQENRM